jgi:hypothetical protein
LSDDPTLAEAPRLRSGIAFVRKTPPRLKTPECVLAFGVTGCLAVMDDYLGLAGEIPEICEVEIDEKLIAK